MERRVAIVGVGSTAFRPVSPELSYKELTYEAAVRAYADAGIDPRRDVDSFVTLAEDYSEGTSIFDEYTPDQIGGALRPVHRVNVADDSAAAAEPDWAREAPCSCGGIDRTGTSPSGTGMRRSSTLAPSGSVSRGLASALAIACSGVCLPTAGPPKEASLSSKVVACGNRGVMIPFLQRG